MQRLLIFCDRCRPDGKIPSKADPNPGRGWLDGWESWEARHAGWACDEEGDYCPDCIEEEGA
jgi:hypothetical protein